MNRALARTLLALLAAASTSCGSSTRGVCTKAKECCSTTSRCEEINRSGPGWEDRCDIDIAGNIEKLRTYRVDACSTIAARYSELVACLAGVACADVDKDGKVSKCLTQAAAYCSALRASGDACGSDYSRYSCDNYQADIDLVFY